MAGLKKVLTPQKMLELLSPPYKMNFSKIGMKYNVSRQRIHQIYKEYKRQYPEMFKLPQEPSKEEIEGLLKKNVPLSKIAATFDISVGRLKKLMFKYGLKKTFIKDVLTTECLKDLYIEQEKTDQEIAQFFNCSPNTVMKLRYSYGIYKHMRKPLCKKLTKELFYELYVEKDLLLSQIAELFNVNIQSVIEIKKSYGIRKRRAKGVSGEELKKIKESLKEKGVIPRG